MRLLFIVVRVGLVDLDFRQPPHFVAGERVELYTFYSSRTDIFDVELFGASQLFPQRHQRGESNRLLPRILGFCLSGLC